MRFPAVLLVAAFTFVGCTDVQAPTLDLSDAVASAKGGDHGPPFITSAVATRDWHSCAIAMGALRCWGWNSNGQLGNGQTGTLEMAPVLVDGPKVEQVSVGGFHSCALDADGVAYCWGNNSRGALGTGDVTSQSQPVPVATDLRFASIRVGNHFTCGLTADGAAYCWGMNNRRQLGSATTESCVLTPTASTPCSTVPVRVDGEYSFASIDVGLWNGCGLTAGGEAICWGNNFEGQLGRGTTGDQEEPAAVAGGHSFTQISVGGQHMCGLASDGLAYCWGGNMFGQLGNGSVATSTTPAPVASGDVRFASIGASSGNVVFGFSCATDAAGAMYCWGANSQGQLGSSAPLPTCSSGRFARPCSRTPIAVVTDLRFDSFAAGFEVICAVSTQHRGYCWGSNEFGALGNPGVELNTSTPTPISATPGRGRGRQGPPADHKNHVTADE